MSVLLNAQKGVVQDMDRLIKNETPDLRRRSYSTTVVDMYLAKIDQLDEFAKRAASAVK